MGEDAPVPVKFPGDDVTVYEDIAFEPDAPAVKETIALADLGTAVTDTGAAGTDVAVIELVAALELEVPIPFLD